MNFLWMEKIEDLLLFCLKKENIWKITAWTFQESGAVLTDRGTAERRN